jgi:predicted phosphodiesterase
LRVNIKGLGSVLFCHATPANDTDIFTRISPEARLASIFAGVAADTVICGHTHMQFDIKVGKTRVVNAGSVGMPFGETGAYWVLLGPDVEFKCTQYDLEAAARIIGKTSYPQRDEFVATSLLHPPSEEQMLANFARADG